MLNMELAIAYLARALPMSFVIWAGLMGFVIGYSRLRRAKPILRAWTTFIITWSAIAAVFYTYGPLSELIGAGVILFSICGILFWPVAIIASKLLPKEWGGRNGCDEIDLSQTISSKTADTFGDALVSDRVNKIARVAGAKYETALLGGAAHQAENSPEISTNIIDDSSSGSKKQNQENNRSNLLVNYLLLLVFFLALSLVLILNI